MDYGRVNKLKKSLAEQIHALSENLLTKFPIDQYIVYLEHYPRFSSYRYVSSDIENYCNNIIKNSSEEVLELYHELVLLSLIVAANEKLKTKELPEPVKRLYNTNFERITRRIEINAYPPGYYTYPQDKFLKDLGVCSLRMIPTGVRKIHLGSLPAREFLFKGGCLQFLRGVALIVYELGGVKPVYHGHLDSHDPDSIAEFSFDGWIRHYKIVAEMLEMNKEIKGLIGRSWYYDPQLKKVSPELSYLGEMVTENGGKLFYVGSNSEAVKNATLMSTNRSRLYNEGEYLPTDYMVVWPRKRLIKWANRDCSFQICQT
jgi:hypothetical protein